VEGISVKRKTPESYVLRAVMDYLAVKKVFAMRMNSGAVLDKRGVPVRMHGPGTADVLAFVKKMACSESTMWSYIVPTWIECKAPNGKQSELQKQFQEKVEAVGHRYLLCYSVDDLIAAGL
jgi:hypothetical protein